MEKIGIVICSRTDSRRVQNKPFIELKGKPVIRHLVDGLLPLNIPVIVATPPHDEYLKYKNHFLDYEYNSKIRFETIAGSKNDPLKRTLEAANYYGFEHVIRICHDKIFLSLDQIKDFIRVYFENGLDYIYSTHFIDGMSFEIFSRKVLTRACQIYKDVENISFAIDACAVNKLNYNGFIYQRSEATKHLRLLIDYPEDITMMKNIFCRYDNPDIEQIIKDYAGDKTFFNVNKLPWVSAYTCAYNAEEYLFDCMVSVINQKNVELEYLMIDDFSTDGTLEMMKRFKEIYKEKVKIFENDYNVGLASSSNVALQNARGKYIIRLDADDYFLNEEIIYSMVDHMERCDFDILYPMNVQNKGIEIVVEQADKFHHAGGAMFRRRALDFLKFTDKLRHFEGKDLYKRAEKSGIKIGYYKIPTFFYRQHGQSLSKSKSTERLQINRMINEGKLGEALTQ